MQVMGLLRWWAGLAVLSFPVVAQASPGQSLAAPRWQAWPRGDEVVLGGDAAPAATLFAFCTGAHAPALAGDADYLVDLQRRFGERGLVTVLVVDDPAAAGGERWQGCRVALDDGSTRMAWLGAGDPPWPLLLGDRAGVVRFVGAPESGLVDAIEHTLAGRDVLAAERTALALRQDLPHSFDDVTADQVVPLLEQSLQHAPRDGLLLGLLYLALATKRNDAAAAAKLVQRTIEVLAAEPRPLAAFADLALRGDPRRPALAVALRSALQPAAAAVPQDVAVQLAYLRALVQSAAGREVGRQSMRMRRIAMATATTALDFAAILASDPEAAVHKDLATMAVERAAALGAPERVLTAVRYAVAARCAGDAEQAARLRDEYLKDTDLRVSLNNDCWYFMTQLPTMGRCDPFAAALAERMLEQEQAMDYFEFDTAALAMFLVGRVEQAVALQQTAIDKGGKDNPEYVERLERYKAGLAPAPR